MSSATIALVTVLAGAAVLLAVGFVMWRKQAPAEEAAPRGGVLPLLGQLDQRVDSASAGGIIGGGVVRRTSNDEWGRPGVLIMTPPVGMPAIAEAAPAASAPEAVAEAAPAPVAPASVAPAPVAPAPVAVAPEAPVEKAAVAAAAPAPVAPPPVAPTPVAPTPVAPTPVAPTPVFSASAATLPYGMLAIAGPAKSVQPVVTKGFGGPSTSARGIAGVMKEWHDLRFQVPEGGAVQFLPGRLEIVAGPDRGREIRFPHVAGPNGVEITFGRSEGEPFRHIQLRDQTVSRLHAGLRFADGQWSLRNYSGTNPVVYNQTVVAGDDEPLLEDGDRIEMGAVIFTFRSR